MNAASWVLWIGILVLLVVVAVVVWSTVRMGGARKDAAGEQPPSEPTHRRVAVVINPIKFADVGRVQYQLDALAETRGWKIDWHETTVEDPGTGQTREATENGAEVVCALGGDGTARAVAAGLVDTGVPMGLLPGGTGNLLARNMEFPIDSLEQCFLIALEGVDRPIDIGRLSVLPEETQDDPKDYYFLVMAGLGFDASVMAQAPEKLKSHLGWPAYVVSGISQLAGHRFEVEVVLDDDLVIHRKVRSILIGNVGRLQGGVELLPDAEVDDGTLDAVILAPKGLSGWAAVALRILTKTRHGHRRVEHLQCHTMRIRLGGGHHQEVQLDGDPIGPARALKATVLQGALVLRTPRTVI
ncbi:diacylglycerol/lipid kinase family protein [Mobilicoccus caccae]|uniref:Sphingosine kinase n=1 Tax=Mobilicoccus caccae TaxID=1859295 RepID=A0ABQ6IXA1_9MICO|nr:diacylglycerol kinase family protein [Mobilicoccus caccae]GMA41362.1 sphingosine kinase [Mobilicoccus caccae]